MSKYVVFRAKAGIPEGFMPPELDGRWEVWTEIPPVVHYHDSIAIALPTGRFETREDGARAEVFEVQPVQKPSLRNGAQRIALERRRQQQEKGYTLAHDRGHRTAALIDYARVFISDWFRDTDNLRPLEKAGALIAAAIDRKDPGVVLSNGVDPRRFLLVRHEDVSGVSGTGIVCEGIEFSDGYVVLHWRGEHPSLVTWARGIESVEAIHGHDGKTTIEWLD